MLFCYALHFATLWTLAHQAPQSMGFSRQEYWSGLPGPPPGDLPHPGIESGSLRSCIVRWVLYHYCHLGSPSVYLLYIREIPCKTEQLSEMTQATILNTIIN